MLAETRIQIFRPGALGIRKWTSPQLAGVKCVDYCKVNAEARPHDLNT